MLRSEQIEREIVGAKGSGGRYGTWLENSRACDGTAIDRAVRWRLTQVLVAHDLQRAQASFEFDALNGDEFEKRAKGVEKAAEYFVRRKVGAPIYFGRQALRQSASNHVEQYLEIAREMFEEISAKVGSQRETPTPLNAPGITPFSARLPVGEPNSLCESFYGADWHPAKSDTASLLRSMRRMEWPLRLWNLGY